MDDVDDFMDDGEPVDRDQALDILNTASVYLSRYESEARGSHADDVWIANGNLKRLISQLTAEWSAE
ncbi:hypothetical protein BcepSauron_351 [Burkholderia phage BcepSauron]|uniref:Uncharacterized protein n=2 Tax=Sarumanvirus TaxID=2843450 RepID=A0A482ML06_9CAUD|nr:hypothetical protein H1O16_gp348 [Burkholderia phage BcepSaruman]YP_009904729.1 hypothetical protein H1O17_gp351 [Burkholderia phage BcepSauron]QBQ74731.1 hypothetical protein BcepSauron_351 [Burkholderia phage BcepSauron]QBX06761.1 hypothetical protein BcepSaruman_348 [Burkholderia phage BcepSaruman]